MFDLTSPTNANKGTSQIDYGRLPYTTHQGWNRVYKQVEEARATNNIQISWTNCRVEQMHRLKLQP